MSDDFSYDSFGNRQQVVIVDITTRMYFAMIDNQVRDIYASFEEHVLLPKVIDLYSSISMSSDLKDLMEFPTEGYYYKTEGLRKYFQLVRNIQHNKNVFSKIDESNENFKLLQKICADDIFGTVKADTESPLPRKKDGLTLCLESMEDYTSRPFTIPTILERVKAFKSGKPGLVEMAIETGDVVCMTAGCETNSLYRMFALMSGCSMIPTKYEYVWKVDAAVETIGSRLVDEYNKILAYIDTENNSGANFYEGTKLIKRTLIKPSINNFHDLSGKIEKPRVAHMGYIRATGENYFWILKDDEQVEDKYTTEFMTTEKYKEGSGQYAKFNTELMIG